MAEIGSRIRLTKNIFDDGQDHHPAGYIGRIGEVVTIKEIYRDGVAFGCAHDWVTNDRLMIVYHGEFEEAL